LDLSLLPVMNNIGSLLSLGEKWCTTFSKGKKGAYVGS